MVAYLIIVRYFLCNESFFFSFSCCTYFSFQKTSPSCPLRSAKPLRMITEANFTAFYFILLAAGKSKVALIYWKTIYDNHLFKSLFLVTLMQMKNERYWELIYYVSEKVSFMTVQYIYNMSRLHCAIKYKGIFKPLTVDLQSYRYFEICCDIKAMKPKPFIWLLITWQNWENIVVSVYINIIQTRFVHLPRNRGANWIQWIDRRLISLLNVITAGSNPAALKWTGMKFHEWQNKISAIRTFNSLSSPHAVRLTATKSLFNLLSIVNWHPYWLCETVQYINASVYLYYYFCLPVS